MMYSVKEAAEKMGVTAVALSAKCKRYGIKKIGAQYVIDDESLKILSERMTSGRPTRKKQTD